MNRSDGGRKLCVFVVLSNFSYAVARSRIVKTSTSNRSRNKQRGEGNGKNAVLSVSENV